MRKLLMLLFVLVLLVSVSANSDLFEEKEAVKSDEFEKASVSLNEQSSVTKPDTIQTQKSISADTKEDSVLEAVHVDTGMVEDAVVDLERDEGVLVDDIELSEPSIAGESVLLLFTLVNDNDEVAEDVVVTVDSGSVLLDGFVYEIGDMRANERIYMGPYINYPEPRDHSGVITVSVGGEEEAYEFNAEIEPTPRSRSPILLPLDDLVLGEGTPHTPILNLDLTDKLFDANGYEDLEFEIEAEHITLEEWDWENKILNLRIEPGWTGSERVIIIINDGRYQAIRSFRLTVEWQSWWKAKRCVELLDPPDYVMVHASQVFVELLIDEEDTFFPCEAIGNYPEDFSCLRLAEEDHRIEYQFLDADYVNASPTDARYLMFFPSTHDNNSFKDYFIYYRNASQVMSVAGTLLDIYEPFEIVTGIDGYKAGDGASINGGILNIPGGARPFWRFDEISTEASYTFEVKLSDCFGDGTRCMITISDETPDRGEYYTKGIYVIIDEYNHHEIYAFFNNRENTLCEQCVNNGDKLKFDCDSGGCWMYIGDNEEAEDPKIQYRGTDGVSGWNMLLVGALEGAVQIDYLKLSTSYNFTTYREDMDYELGDEIDIEDEDG